MLACAPCSICATLPRRDVVNCSGEGETVPSCARDVVNDSGGGEMIPPCVRDVVGDPGGGDFEDDISLAGNC